MRQLGVLMTAAQKRLLLALTVGHCTRNRHTHNFTIHASSGFIRGIPSQGRIT